MEDRTKKAAPERPKRRWAAFWSDESFWEETAEWTAIVFVLSVGLASIAWAYFGGNEWVSSLSYALRHNRTEVAEEEAAKQDALDPATTRSIDGIPVGGDRARYHGVIIDNIRSARPPAGLTEASLVIEAPVEGGITRLMAFFREGEEVPKIGPIRSVRPYYVDWADEYDALIVHVGGSPEALEMIDERDQKGLNQFFWGEYYWRDRDRSAPHNVYTSGGLLAKAGSEVRKETRDVRSWKYKADLPHQWRPDLSRDLVVRYSSNSYGVTWAYDRAENVYKRYQGTSLHLDESGEAVRAKNIIVQYTEMKVVDDIGRIALKTTGTGDALVARDGHVIRGTWEKGDVKERLRLIAGGEEILFNVGTTWIEVVPVDAPITY